MEVLYGFISAGDYHSALQQCKEYDNYYQNVVNDADALRFHAIYLTLLLWQGDVEEARYFWLRSPESVKGASDIFSAVYSIAQHIYNKDPTNAHKAIDDITTPWIQPLMDNLRLRFAEAELNTVAKAYSCISLDELSARLGMKSRPSVIQKVQTRGWIVDEDSGLVKPNNDDANGGGDKSGDLLNQGDLVHTLSTYIAHFESKPMNMNSTKGGTLETVGL